MPALPSTTIIEKYKKGETTKLEVYELEFAKLGTLGLTFACMVFENFHWLKQNESV